MKLEIIEGSPAFPILHVMSENKRWELGIAPLTVYRGIRINAGLVNSGSYEIVYCCGQDIYSAIRVLLTVAEIFLYLDEEITPLQLHNLFPVFEIKPIMYDPNFKLLESLLVIVKSSNTETEENITFMKVLEVTVTIILEGSVTI